jgi:ParB-like chromosome segregation protein Spo0J
MQRLPLTAIRLDGGTQARIRIDEKVFEEYALKMKEGSVFPPIVVFKDPEGEIWLGDGFHRYHAHKLNGETDIECDVKAGTQRDAKLYSWSANKNRGLQMTWEDNRKVILEMLQDPECAKWSDAEIARHVGVSKMTVGRIRKKLKGETPQPKKRKYIDSHGNEPVMNTENIGKTKAAKEEPLEKPVEVADDRIDELVNLVSTLSEENESLKDKIAVGQWDATDIEKIDIQETVTELRKQIKVLEIENKTLRESRDMYQNRNAELMRTVKSLQTKLKKLEGK